MKKRIVAACMTVIMLLTALSGCGKSKDDGNSQVAASSKDYVYKVTDVDVDFGNDSSPSLFGAGNTLMAYGYDYGKEGGMTVHFASLDENGAIVKEMALDTEDNISINNPACDKDGNIYYVKDVYASEPDENDNYTDTYYLEKINMDGEQLFSICVNELPDVQKQITENGGWFYMGSIFFYQDMLYAEVMGNICLFDLDGNYQKMLVAGDKEDMVDVGNIYALASGKVAGIIWDDNGVNIGYVDMNTGTLTDKTKLPGYSYDYSIYAGNSKYELFLVNSIGLYGYNIGDTDTKLLMNFVDSDIAGYSVYNVISINDDEFFATYDAEDGNALGRFTKVPPSEVKDKKTLVLACDGINYDVRNNVVKFNKSNDEYRITIQDYAALYNTEDDYQAGLNRLNADIVSGKIPDILVISDSMPVESYISKGLFEDLKPYIEKDEDLDINNFMPNILDAFSVDGRLYRLVPSYMISTLIAKTSLVGEERGWTIEEANRIMSGMPEGASFLPNMDRGSMLINCMTMAGNQFLDFDEGTCNFDSDSFIEMLEFLKQFPEQVDDTMYDDSYWESYDTMWRENRALTMSYSLSGFKDYNYTKKGTFGEDITLIGFPSSNEDGSSIVPAMQFAMSAKSANKEGAWQFMRYYLTDEYQDEVSFGFPVSIRALDTMGENSMKVDTYIDENGNEVESPDYYYMNGVEVEIKPMTQEEVENFKQMLYTFNQVYSYDQELMNIISEESAAFFSGQKSAKDVAAIIQSRVQIYVNENR